MCSIAVKYVHWRSRKLLLSKARKATQSNKNTEGTQY
jgi:hypothetical protein